MPDQELETDPIDDVVDELEAGETPETDEVPDQDSEADAELRELFAQQFPGLPFDELSTKAMLTLALKKATAKTDGGESEDSATQRPARQPVASFDTEATRKSLEAAFLEGDAAAATKAIDEYLRTHVQAVMDIALSQDERIEALTRPRQLKAAMPQVRGATEADLQRADDLLNSKEAATPQAALKVAVYEWEHAPRRSASQSARRKAAALSANAHGRGEAPRGVTVSQIPQTAEEMKAFMEREAAAGV